MRAFITFALLIVCAGVASASFCNQGCGLFGFCLEGSCQNGVCNCGGVKGDPELRGLDGRTFFFGDNFAGHVFNLISEEHHQLNALFVEGPHKIAHLGSTEEALNGTFVGSMGFKMNGQMVQVDTDDEGAMTVVINGKPVILTQENNFESIATFDKLNVTTHKYREGLGETVHLVSDVFDFLVYATPRAWDEETKEMNRGHLNMGLGVNADNYFTRTVHGVLGQITPDTHPDVNSLPEELREAFLGEGSEEDYIIQGGDLFGDDFKFNLYGVAQPAKKAVSRRHLREGLGGQWLSIGKFGF